MALDKRIPRVLNSDTDSKTLNKVSMTDALNLYSGPDNEGFQGGEKSGSGDQILKNIKGNQLVFTHPGEELPSDARVIGSVEEVKSEITYFFVYSSNAENQGVWAYDKNDTLNLYNSGVQQGPSVRLIYKSAQFNFSQNGFVKGDIVYTAASKTLDSLGDRFDKDVIIYFTDGENEPRKLNAYRAFASSSGSNIHGDDVFAEADFITACPKTQLKPITFFFDNDPEANPEDIRTINNFDRSPGFQFAYQHIYVDGMESAISSYSDMAFLPSVIDQGAATYQNHPNYRCVLNIPACGPEIKSVRILARQGNYSDFLIIDEIDASEENQQYSFFNDRVLKGVSRDEVNKQFDSVPRKAKAQTVSSNRLMYGNYLDGFDKSSTSGTATVIYKDRPEDFKTFGVNYIPSVFQRAFAPGVTSENIAFFLDFSELPDEISAGVDVIVNFTLRPQRNFHYYYRSTSQTAQRGPQPISADNGQWTDVNYHQSLSLFDDQDQLGATAYTESVNGVLNNLGLIWGQSFDDSIPYGVSLGDSVWKRHDIPQINGSAHDEDFPSETQTARFGTSATAPFIFKGGNLTFSASLSITEDITDAREKINLAVCEAFTNPNIPSGLPLIGYLSGITINSNTAEASYSFDLGLKGGDYIAQHRVGQGSGLSPLEHSEKIIPVWGGDSTSETGVPTGYFIVNKATPSFTLTPEEKDFSQDTDSYWRTNSQYSQYLADVMDIEERHVSHFSLRLVGFEDWEALTCIHDTARPPSASYTWIPNNNWIVLDDDSISEIQEVGSYEWANNLGLGDFAGFGNSPVGQGTFYSAKGYGNQIGEIIGAFSDNTNSTEIVQVNPQISLAPSPFVPEDYWGLYAFPTNLVLSDGEGGPGGGPAKDFFESEHPYDKLKLYLQGSVTVNPYYDYQLGGVDGNFFVNTVFYRGVIEPAPSGAGVNSTSDGVATILPFLLRKDGQNASNPPYYEYQVPQGNGNGTDEPGPLFSNSVDFKKNQTVLELLTKETIITTQDSGGFGHESFKTNANHDFGIIYYDERGRHGFVDYLDTVFVKPYSERDEKGRVEVKIELEGTPPSWAHSYKIAYSKNSSVQDFVQYTAGGAFVGGDPDDVEPTDANKNIYVSLNYLQGHEVSYVSAFGARTPEGGLNFYKYQPGDKLQVISYGDGDNRQYVNYEFDVVDLVDLGETDNPLSNNPEENQKGQFVVLKDNTAADGFSFLDVSTGDESNNWLKNCVIELRTPKKVIDPEDQFYYEVSPSYDVIKSVNPQNEEVELVHGVNPVVVSKGDVWFRRVPTNVRKISGGQFLDIIPNDDGADPSPQPNFTNVYLETNSVSDLFRSDSLSIGRPNVTLDDASEVRRENTITFSDPSNPESKKVNYSSFNASLANFKDISERYGEIQYIGDHSGYIFVIQEDKISMIPTGKNIISDASGNSQLISSLNVLGEVISYPEVSGCDEDPSSVYDSGAQVFFCNKSLSKVYRWTKNNGVEVISDKGMSSVIRASLKRAIDTPGLTRVVSGFDPLKEEYLLSIQSLPDNPLTLNTVEKPDQVFGEVIDGTTQPGGFEDGFDEGDTGTDDDGGGDDEFDPTDDENTDETENNPLLIQFTEAYNDFFLTDLTPGDMSAQLAIDYLNALSEAPLEEQPTGSQIKELLTSVNENSMKRLVLDTYGDNNNAVGESTDSQDFMNLIQGPNEILGDAFDPGLSIFQDNIIQTGFAPPPVSNNPPPNFETIEDAVQYLEQNRVLRVHDIVRLNKYSNPNIVLNVVDRFGNQIINAQELLAILGAFGTTMNGMESPYGIQPTDYDTAEYTGSQVIDQIITDFYDVMTVEQYHRILNDVYPNPNTGIATSGVSTVAAMVAASGGFIGYFGADYDYECSTATLLFFLAQYGIDNGITLEGLSANPEIL